MKKMKKLVAAVLVLASLSLVLTGCVDIDEMRSKQGYWTDAVNITYGENDYYILPECKYIDLRSYNEIYITGSDVPVLVSEMFGEQGMIGNNGIIIQMYDGTVFCRSDKFESIKSRIINGVTMDKLFYTVMRYDTELQDIVPIETLLSDAEYNVVIDTLNNGSPIEQRGYYDAIIELYRCSDDMIFTEYAFDLVEIDGEYYVSVYNEENGGAVLYAVASQHKAVIKSLFDNFESLVTG